MQWHHPTLSTRCFLTLDILSNVNKIKATEHFFLVALLIMLYKVVLTFESVAEILWCDHSNKSYWAVPSCGTVDYAVQGSSNVWVCGWNPMVRPFKWSCAYYEAKLG